MTSDVEPVGPAAGGRVDAAWVGTAAYGLVLAANVVFCVLTVFRRPFGWDELQHAHITWHVSQGEVVYRDFFEHHGPLYPLVNGILWRIFGWESRFETLHVLRLVSCAFLAVILWTTYAMGRLLSGRRRVGLFAATVASSFLWFQEKATEIRPDLLQNALWLGALYFVLAAQTGKRSRMVVAGLLAGLAVQTNTKAALGIVAVGGFLVASILWETERRRALAADLGAMIGGFFVSSSVVLGYFAATGALRQLLDLAYLHNVLLLREHSAADGIHMFLVKPLRHDGVFIVIALVGLLRAWSAARKAESDGARRALRLLVVATVVTSAGILSGQYMQYYLCFLPLFGVSVGLYFDGPDGLFSRLSSGPRSRLRFAQVALALWFSWSVVGTFFFRESVAPEAWMAIQTLAEQRASTKAILDGTARGEPAALLSPQCAGYSFVPDAQYHWWPDPHNVQVLMRTEKRDVFGADLIATLEARRVRYVLFHESGLPPPRPLVRAHLDRAYEREGPCLLRRRAEASISDRP